MCIVYASTLLYLCVNVSFRKQYASWKEECKKMFPVIGSGSFITAPVVTENGQPNLDPLVVQEINLGKKKKNIIFFPFFPISLSFFFLIPCASSLSLRYKLKWFSFL